MSAKLFGEEVLLESMTYILFVIVLGPIMEESQHIKIVLPVGRGIVPRWL